MIERLAGWHGRLAAVIADEHRRRDYPGRCVDFACAAIDALYGTDPMPGWRGRFDVRALWDTGSSAAMLRVAMRDCADRFGWMLCERGSVRDGCVAIAHPPRARTSGLMIVSGGKILRTVDPRGLHSMGMTFADEFWRT